MIKMISRVKAAESLQVSRQTVANWEKKGILHAVKIGGCYKYDKKEVDALLSGLTSIQEKENAVKKYEHELDIIITHLERVKEEVLMEIGFWEGRGRNIKRLLLNIVECVYKKRDGEWNDRNADILYDYIKTGGNTEFVADFYGYSKQRILQIIDRFIRRARYYPHICDIYDYKEENEKLKEKVEFLKKHSHAPAILSTKLTDMDLTVRALHCLKAAKIETLGDLVLYKQHELLKFRNFGRKTLRELDDLVKSKGLQWGFTYD